MTSMYTCPARIERDGWLVAFEGERMSVEEAARRGLLAGAEPGKEPEKAAKAPARRSRKAASK